MTACCSSSAGARCTGGLPTLPFPRPPADPLDAGPFDPGPIAPAPLDPGPLDPSPPDSRRVALHPPRLWREVALLGVLWLLYIAVRGFVPNDLSAAVRRGQDLLALEQAWFGAPVAQLNAALVALPGLAVVANYFYATLHYLLTPAVLVWLHRRHGEAYRSARTVLLVATVIALVLFWLFPTAPPRLLPAGFVDTMATWSSYGWWSDAASAPRGLTSLSNQLAAMPSMHVGWAVWVGWQLWRRGGRPLLRAAGVLYPSLTTLVVVATANHYVVDALAGAAVVAAAAVAVHWRPRELSGGRREVLC